MRSPLVEAVGRSWDIFCSRCANGAQSDAPSRDDAANDFAARGWSLEEGRIFCPQCNGGQP